MNIIDAIRSRRPRRFPDSSTAANQEWHTVGFYDTNDVLTDCWEIQEPTITITRTQFWDAAKAVYRNAQAKNVLLSALARKLGLEAAP